MSLVKPPYKTFLIPLAISVIAMFTVFSIYYVTKGGFFDGVLLTIIGISSTFFALVLSVIIFKALSDLLVRNSYRILGVIVSFILTFVIMYFLLMALFILVTETVF